MGLILNKFTYDIDFVDRWLPRWTVFLLGTFFDACKGIYGFFVVAPFWVAIGPTLLFLVSLYILQEFYVRAKNNIYRFASSTKAPLVSLSDEIGEGMVTIRALKKEKVFEKKIEEGVNENVKYFPMVEALRSGYIFWVEVINLCCL